MKINEKGFIGRLFLILAISNIAVYVFYHISYLMEYNWFEYVRTYIAEIWEFLFIPISVVVMLELHSQNRKLDAFKTALLCSVARVFYTIPFYYMEYMRESYPPNSFDSFIISMLFTLITVVITFAHLYFVYGILLLIYHLRSKGDKDHLAKSLNGKASFDFSSPASLICLIVCLLQFVIKLVGVIVDTVSFLLQYGGGYTLPEILTMLLDYVICIGLLVVSYLLVCKTRNIIKTEEN